MTMIFYRRRVHKMLLFLVFFFISIHSFSQVTYDKEAEYWTFEEFNTADDFLYTYTSVKSSYDKGELIIYDHSGTELNKIVLQSKRRPVIYNTTSCNGITYFELSTDEYLGLDKQGKEVFRKTLPVSADKVKTSRTLFTEAGVTVVQQVKVKKVGVGLRVIRYNNDFEQQWVYENIPEKGRYAVGDCTADAAGNVAVVYTKGDMSNSYEKGICLLSNTGEEKAFAKLDLKKSNIDPFQFKYAADGSIAYTSYYGSTNSEAFKGIPLGFSFVSIDGSTGAVKSEEYVDFLEVQKAAGDKRTDGTPVYNQKAPALHYLDKVSIDGKQYFLCESYTASERKYTKPATNSQSVANITYYTTLTLMDYYLLDASDLGATPLRVWKQPRTIEMELGSYAGPLALLGRMKNNNLFSYKGMQDGKIVTVGYGQLHNYYTLIDPAQGKENLSARTFWGEPINTLDLTILPQRKSYSLPSLQTIMPKYIANEGVVKSGDSYLLYHYDYRSNMLQFSKLQF